MTDKLTPAQSKAIAERLVKAQLHALAAAEALGLHESTKLAMAGIVDTAVIIATESNPREKA